MGLCRWEVGIPECAPMPRGDQGPEQQPYDPGKLYESLGVRQGQTRLLRAVIRHSPFLVYRCNVYQCQLLLLPTTVS